MRGAALVIFDPVQLNDDNLLSTQLAEDRLQNMTELPAHVGCDEPRQSIRRSTDDVRSEPVLAGRLEMYHRTSTGHLQQRSPNYRQLLGL